MRSMVCMGRKAQPVARGRRYIRAEIHPGRRRAVNPVFTRVVNASPRHGQYRVWLDLHDLVLA